MNERKVKRQKYSKVKPDQRQALLDIERITNAEIPDYQNITSENFGMVLENRCVIYLALYNLKIENIPESIGQLTSLRKLYLGRNKIRFLPKTIGNLKELEILDLNNNQIEDLPIEIGDLDCLRVLNLIVNNLTSIPSSMNNLSKIENLNLGGNDIKYYPDIYFALKYGIKLNQVKALLNIEQYIKRKIPCKETLSNVDVCYIKQNKNIIGLCLNICGLDKLPDSIKSLKNLRYLYLGNNILTHLPQFICELEKLEYLELHDNKLADLPTNINNLDSLKGISLYGNNFEVIPRSLFLLRKLEVLDLRNNNIQELPNSIKDLENLHEIEFSGNQIKDIPTLILKKKYNLKASDAKFLWNLENLLDLKIKKSNKISQNDFGYVSKNREIESLALYDCGLTEIPKNISRLKSLEFLYLGKNNIKIIPDFIEFMQKLTILDISDNIIQRISEKIGELTQIKEIYLNNNLIRKLPPSLGKLKNLKKILLQKNKITRIGNELEGFKSIPIEIMLDWAKMEVLPNYLTIKCFGLRFNDLKIKLRLEELIKNEIPKTDLMDLNKVDMYRLGYSERNGHIEILCFRHLNLKKIPDYLPKLNKLRVLYLDGNDISEIPDQLYNLKKLVKLKLSNNKLTRVSVKIKNLKSIQWLDLSTNKLDVIPKELLENPFLKYLNLKNNNIREIPDVPPNDISLEEIYLKDNPIVKIPDSLVSVNALKILSVDWHNLESISDDLLKFQYSMEKDQALFVRDIKNIITKEFSIKDNIGFNTCGYKKDNGNIVELCLYKCNLKEIPESIGNLVYLQKLFLNNNQLKSLPQTIKKSSELIYLNIKNNRFEKLTPELYYLNKLEVLKWKGNNWEEESLQAIKKGVVYIRDYCKEIILVDIFLSHKVNEFPLFHIEEIAGYLKNQDEINNVYYCEEDLVGDIDSFMERYVPESDILIFFGSKNSIYDSKDCEKEIKLAKDNEKLFITIKSDDIEWPEFSKYNLERIKGIEWRGEDKFSEFLAELYKEIQKLKREYDNQIVNAN